MKALSVRQPWAWMIVHGWKDIENRTWWTSVTGRILIHAAKSMTHDEYEEAFLLARTIGWFDMGKMPTFGAIDRGGIVGSVELVACVGKSDSPWFFGPHGFVLRAPKVLIFTPCLGKLGFFDAPWMHAA